MLGLFTGRGILEGQACGGFIAVHSDWSGICTVVPFFGSLRIAFFIGPLISLESQCRTGRAIRRGSSEPNATSYKVR